MGESFGPLSGATQPGLTAETAARIAADALLQPLDDDLTAIAALATSSFGRSLLTQADAATARTTLGVTSGGFGNLRVLGADATLADTYSLIYVDYVEVGSGFVFELAGDSVVEILT